jgi:cell division protease FtsH
MRFAIRKQGAEDRSSPTDPRQNREQANPPRRKTWLVLLLFLSTMLFVREYFNRAAVSQSVPYSQFLEWLSRGQVESVTLESQKVRGVLKEAIPQLGGRKEFNVFRVEDSELVDRLNSKGVQFSGIQEASGWVMFLSWIMPALVMVAIWSFFMRRMSGPVGGGVLSMGKSRARVYVEKDIHTRFTDVAGIDEAKQELYELVQFLKNPETHGRLGGRVPKGILLVGPPGTGKTLAARAVAGEANVPFYSINGSEFVELFVGLGAARVRDLFKEARESAPCIVFIDELDAIGKIRGASAMAGGSNDEKEQTLNQLLAEIDGFDASRGIVLLAATNRPEILDPALLRSGRFDRQILIDKPDRLGRKAILEIHLQKVKRGESVSTEQLAGLTAGFSGADLANLVNEATLVATRRGADQVEMNDFTEAIERLVAGLERKTRILSAPEKERVAYHELGHAIANLVVGGNDQVHKVSIIPRGMGALGYNLRRPQEDKYLLSKKELEDTLVVFLGGRAAEEVFLREISTGAADDLDKATDLARSMVARYGMSEELGIATYDVLQSPMLAGGAFAGVQTRRDYSERTADRLDEEVRKVLKQAREKAVQVLRANSEAMKWGVELLIRKETLTAEDLSDLKDRLVGASDSAERNGLALHLLKKNEKGETAV